MIKLSKGVPPGYLSKDKIKELTDKYKNEKRSVWIRKGITLPLRKTSSNKCAYCEIKVNGNGSYMEVDHFRYKDKYQEHVVEWDNLIPSCKQCNTKKGKHDIEVNPILNPYHDNPKDHLCYCNYCIIGLTEKGRMTESLLGFNNNESNARINRLLISEKLNKSLHQGYDYLKVFDATNDVIYLNKAKNVLSGLLSSCGGNYEYSAITSTLLLLDPEFEKVIDKIKREDKWDDEMEQNLTIAISHAFIVKNKKSSFICYLDEKGDS